MGNIAPALWRGTMPQTVQLNDPALLKRMADRILFIEDGKMRFNLPLQQAVIWWQVNGYRDYLPEMGL